ncbi:uncharacterized protein LOC105640618 isoform X2 [Jatropha curcas]|uniref:uncharacterized protein LOC105640618 isoform X2 n=1 Tax=Jatropha curcas TaxID=180498 RepID=UPI0009D768AF|nr:uncharacterized protein LOC105640618 isoform X2 [Jatropha curcas]
MLILVKTCHICGDVGFLEMIVTCFQCKITREHVYCMPVLLLSTPEIWICEICQSSKDKESQQSFMEEHFPLALTPNNSEIVHNDTMQSMAAGNLRDYSRILVHLQKETAPGKGELTSSSSEEAIKLSSGTQKVENSSPSTQGPSSGQSISRIISTRTAIGFKPPPLEHSQQVIETSTNIGLKKQLMPLGRCSAECSSMTQQHAYQMEDKKTPLAYQDKCVFKEEPVEILLPAKSVES